MSALFRTSSLSLTLAFFCACSFLTGCSDDQTNAMIANADGTFSLNAQDQAKAQAQGYEVPSFHMAQLEWQPPISRSGGLPQSPTEIKSYFVHYFMKGSDEEASKTPIKINVGNRTRVGMPLELPGTYYFAVSTVDNEKRESEPTAFVAVNVQ